MLSPFKLSAYSGDLLQSELESGAKLSAAGYDRHRNKLGIDVSCRAKQGAPSFIYNNPKLIMHTCDTNGGSSGQGIFLDGKLIAVHTGSSEGPDHYEAWDFNRNINRGIFITQEMVEAAESLVLNP